MGQNPGLRRTLSMPEVLNAAPPSQNGRRDAAKATKRDRFWRRLPWIATLAVILVVAFSLTQQRQQLPLMTRESLTAAESRWKRTGISDYEVIIETSPGGLKTATVRAIVQDHHAIELVVNNEPASAGDPGAYTVDGLFRVLWREIQNNERAEGPGEQPLPRSVVRAAFDSTTGVPMRFLRMVPGSNTSSGWRITSLKPRPLSTTRTGEPVVAPSSRGEER